MRIAMSKEGEKLPHMLLDAEAMGKATGVLSTVRLTHATPASFSTHDVGRGNEEEIARKMLMECPVDLIMAPGHPWFDNSGKQVGGMDPDPYATTGNARRAGTDASGAAADAALGSDSCASTRSRALGRSPPMSGVSGASARRSTGARSCSC